MKRTKNLILCETKIGEVVGSYNNELLKTSVYYGNFLSPSYNDQFIHLKFDDYTKMLQAFLTSEEGEEYIVPTDEEIKDSFYQTAMKEVNAIKERIQENPEENEDELKQFISLEENQKEIKKRIGIISPTFILELMLVFIVCLSYFGYNLYLQFNELQTQFVQMEDYVYQNPENATITVDPTQESEQNQEVIVIKE